MANTTLYADLATLIETRTGSILEATRTQRGYSSDYTGIIRTGTGHVFVKAVRDPGRYVSSVEREAAINSAVLHIAPELLWQARGQGWFVLGFQYVEGRHASFSPGSPDLPAVLRAVDIIGRTPLPDVAGDWRENRYDRYTDHPELFGGDVLLHTDINPDNLLVRDDGEVTVVDWSWPTHGAAWMDLATLVVQLISAGHSPAGAEDWASRCSAWRRANTAAVDAFAVATVRMYERFEERDPAPWRKAMTSAARAWAGHREQD
jgi:hypothetical protein